MDIDTKRIDVWCVLSDLYLDDEIDESGIQYIAKRLVESEFTPLEIEEILFNEVHPAFYWNLCQVAGQWGYFDREWVIDSATKVLNKPKSSSWLQRLRERGNSAYIEKKRSIIEPDWIKIKTILNDIYNAS